MAVHTRLPFRVGVWTELREGHAVRPASSLRSRRPSVAPVRNGRNPQTPPHLEALSRQRFPDPRGAPLSSAITAAVSLYDGNCEHEAYSPTGIPVGPSDIPAGDQRDFQICRSDASTRRRPSERASSTPRCLITCWSCMRRRRPAARAKRCGDWDRRCGAWNAASDYRLLRKHVVDARWESARQGAGH